MKKMWIVLAGNVPVCIKKGEIFPITAFVKQRKSIFIPIFDNFHKARTFSYKIKNRDILFATSVRITEVKLYKEIGGSFKK
jgi:hypothetical protein